MSYDFKTLSPADFEDLARDLIGADLGIKFEAFGPGPDQGIDGRHATAGETIVLQAKHYSGSTFASLTAAMKKERKSIDKLDAGRYILATSRLLTPPNKKKLSRIIGPTLQGTADILGAAELNAMLRRHPDVERAHIKLWLSSAAVLERFLRSAAYEYTSTTRDEIEEKLRVYAPNPSFAKAREILEKRHVLIVSGPPGVGKTTLAEMLAYAYIGDEWEFASIRSLADGFAEFEKTRRQIFFFDDFLGKIALDRNSLAANDAQFAKFVRRVRKSKNARFVLTTRAYIFEEARRVSEAIGDRGLDVSKYLLDVGVYTRRIRARIFYNHLAASSLSPDYTFALLNGDALSTIVDHENYNPRIIEWMTDLHSIHDVSPTNYVEHFVSSLEHPIDIWDRAFREHIPIKAQHLLICMFFASEYGERIADLRTQFEALHEKLCDKHRMPSQPTDFEDALKVLEGSFISLNSHSALFINPSVRDYLYQYLNDAILLEDIAMSSKTGSWARAVWRHYGELKDIDAPARAKFANQFVEVAGNFNKIPRWRSSPRQPNARYRFDLALTDRCKLLAEWALVSNNHRFAEALRDLVENPPTRFSASDDCADIPELIELFQGSEWDDVKCMEGVSDLLEQHLVDILNSGSAGDSELERVVEGCEMHSLAISERLVGVVRGAIGDELDRVSSVIYEIDSEASLDEYEDNLKIIAKWAGINVEPALEKTASRMQQIQFDEEEYSEPTFPTGEKVGRDDFDDEALKSMFGTLTQ